MIRTQRCKRRKKTKESNSIGCDYDAIEMTPRESHSFAARLSRSRPCSSLRNYYYYYIFTFVVSWCIFVVFIVLYVIRKEYCHFGHIQRIILILKGESKHILKNRRKRKKNWSWYAETRSRSFSAESLAVEILFLSSNCELLCISAKGTEQNKRSKRETFIEINSRETLAVCEMWMAGVVRALAIWFVFYHLRGFSQSDCVYII